MGFPKTINYPCIGVACIVKQNKKLLLGKRKGSHGSGNWAFPGGHLEFKEKVEDCAIHELLEETGLQALSIYIGPWVENFMEDAKKHYITIFAFIDKFNGKLNILEPSKCISWKWFDLDRLPTPLFSPISSLIAKHPDIFSQTDFQGKVLNEFSHSHLSHSHLYIKKNITT